MYIRKKLLYSAFLFCISKLAPFLHIILAALLGWLGRASPSFSPLPFLGKNPTASLLPLLIHLYDI
jgi:hypothetical protein